MPDIRRNRYIMTVVAALALAGCTSVPLDVPKNESYAIADTSATGNRAIA